MRVVKIEAEGPTSSFRYPHFMQGVHPTFEMPPPATIYGHICSALGEWIDPEGVEFAYHFSYQAQFDDVEHVHVLSASTGKLPGSSLPKVLEGAVNPFKREILFNPRLVLYINRPEWQGSFCHPQYPVVLGRSQDLFTYSNVKAIDLQESEHAYFEHTLAPYGMVLKLGRGYAILMPRFLDYETGRAPVFARYVILRDRVHTNSFIRFANEPASSYWVDPESPIHAGDRLGLLFHSFVGAYDDSPVMA